MRVTCRYPFEGFVWYEKEIYMVVGCEPFFYALNDPKPDEPYRFAYDFKVTLLPEDSNETIKVWSTDLRAVTRDSLLKAEREWREKRGFWGVEEL